MYLPTRRCRTCDRRSRRRWPAGSSATTSPRRTCASRRHRRPRPSRRTADAARAPPLTATTTTTCPSSYKSSLSSPLNRVLWRDARLILGPRLLWSWRDVFLSSAACLFVRVGVGSVENLGYFCSRSWILEGCAFWKLDGRDRRMRGCFPGGFWVFECDCICDVLFNFVVVLEYYGVRIGILYYCVKLAWIFDVLWNEGCVLFEENTIERLHRTKSHYDQEVYQAVTRDCYEDYRGSLEPTLRMSLEVAWRILYSFSLEVFRWDENSLRPSEI